MVSDRADAAGQGVRSGADDSDFVEAAGAQPIIPQRSCMPRERALDPAKYKLRNRIERTIGKLTQLRRIATRYDRIPQNYLAGLYLAAISFWS